MTIQTLRPLVLMLLALITGFGWITEDLRKLVEANADSILAGVLALWAIVAHLRNRKDQKASDPLSGLRGAR